VVRVEVENCKIARPTELLLDKGIEEIGGRLKIAPKAGFGLVFDYRHRKVSFIASQQGFVV